MKKEKKLCSCGLYAKYHYYENKKVTKSYSFKGMWICECKKIYFDNDTKIYKDDVKTNPIDNGMNFINKCRNANMSNEDFNIILKLIKKYNLKL